MDKKVHDPGWSGWVNATNSTTRRGVTGRPTCVLSPYPNLKPRSQDTRVDLGTLEKRGGGVRVLKKQVRRNFHTDKQNKSEAGKTPCIRHWDMTLHK